MSTEKIKKDKNSMPDPWEILGGLAAPKASWPNHTDPDREHYLRETKAHEELLYCFTKVMVMNDYFRQKGLQKGVSSYMGASLEAFLVITYVNSYEAWTEECTGTTPPRRTVAFDKDGEESNSSSVTDSSAATTTSQQSAKRFTAAAKGKGKHKGWSLSGRELYSKIGEILKEQRLDSSNPVLSSFDQKLLERFKNGDNPAPRPTQEAEVPEFNDLDTAFSDDDT